MIIVIDGPAGTGKSSVAQRIADSWNIAYIDTGAMYRMLTLFCIQKEIDIYDEHSLKEVLDSFVFDIAIVDGKQAYFLGDEDVTEKIRSLEVSKKVSHVSELSDFWWHRFTDTRKAVLRWVAAPKGNPFQCSGESDN